MGAVRQVVAGGAGGGTEEEQTRRSLAICYLVNDAAFDVWPRLGSKGSGQDNTWPRL